MSLPIPDSVQVPLTTIRVVEPSVDREMAGCCIAI
jgi:hypothetical protein